MMASGKQKSVVWDYFELIDKKKVKCKLCTDETVLAYRGGTTTIESFDEP